MEYVTRTAGKLTPHFLPGCAPDLNPDELVWSHAKRTGVTSSPLKAGEKLLCRVDVQLQNIANVSGLVKSILSTSTCLLNHTQSAKRTGSVGWVNSCAAGIYVLTTGQLSSLASANSTPRALLMNRVALVAWSQQTLNATGIGKSP